MSADDETTGQSRGAGPETRAMADGMDTLYQAGLKAARTGDVTRALEWIRHALHEAEGQASAAQDGSTDNQLFQAKCHRKLAEFHTYLAHYRDSLASLDQAAALYPSDHPEQLRVATLRASTLLYLNRTAEARDLIHAVKEQSLKHRIDDAELCESLSFFVPYIEAKIALTEGRYIDAHRLRILLAGAYQDANEPSHLHAAGLAKALQADALAPDPEDAAAQWYLDDAKALVGQAHELRPTPEFEASLVFIEMLRAKRYLRREPETATDLMRSAADALANCGLGTGPADVQVQKAALLLRLGLALKDSSLERTARVHLLHLSQEPDFELWLAHDFATRFSFDRPIVPLCEADPETIRELSPASARRRSSLLTHVLEQKSLLARGLAASAAFCAVLFATVALAGGGPVSGKVALPDGVPAVGAIVEVVAVATDESVTTQTDAAGGFAVKMASDGPVQVTVTYGPCRASVRDLPPLSNGIVLTCP